MTKLGSLNWARKTGGKMRIIDRLELIRQSVATSIKQHKLFAGSKHPSMDNLELLSIPDTEGVILMAQTLESMASNEVVAHSYRTYYWGALLGHTHNIKFDKEMLALAALAHDLGLANPELKNIDEHCFTLTSARILKNTLSNQYISEEQIEIMQEAITLHFNLQVPLSHGPEAHLLHAGAVLDVTGKRKEELATRVVREVLEQHPRLNFKRHITHCFCQLCTNHPKSRPAMMMALGLKKVIENSPFNS